MTNHASKEYIVWSCLSIRALTLSAIIVLIILLEPCGLKSPWRISAPGPFPLTLIDTLTVSYINTKLLPTLNVPSMETISNSSLEPKSDGLTPSLPKPSESVPTKSTVKTRTTRRPHGTTARKRKSRRYAPVVKSASPESSESVQNLSEAEEGSLGSDSSNPIEIYSSPSIADSLGSNSSEDLSEDSSSSDVPPLKRSKAVSKLPKTSQANGVTESASSSTVQPVSASRGLCVRSVRDLATACGLPQLVSQDAGKL